MPPIQTRLCHIVANRLAGKVQGPLEAGANKDPLRVYSLRRPVQRLTSWPDMVRTRFKRLVSAPGPADHGVDVLRASSGSLAMFAAIRRASSRVSTLAAVRLPGSSSQYT